MGMQFVNLLVDSFTSNFISIKSKLKENNFLKDVDLLESVVEKRLQTQNLPLSTTENNTISLNTGFENQPLSTNPSTTSLRSMLQHTIPDTKLFYPEPFLASPSYLHSDLFFFTNITVLVLGVV